jgi:hypothetical protein
MAVVGIVSQDVVTKSRIAEVLNEKNIETVYVHSAGNFDRDSFDVLMVDLDSPLANLVIKSMAAKCIAFGSSNDEEKLKQAVNLGCDRVYKLGEFFKKVLPQFELK